jgi:hypothetical protein
MSDIYLQITETPTVVTLSAPVVSGALAATVTVANVVSVNVVTMPAINVTAAVSGGLSNAELRASAVSVAVTTMPAISISSVTVSNFPASQTVAGTVTIGSCVTHGVNVANSVTISSLPAISGTVTANVPLINILENQRVPAVPVYLAGSADGPTIDVVNYVNDVNNVLSLPPISGTVTANVPLINVLENQRVPAVPVYLAACADGPTIDVVNYVNDVLSLPPISGTVTVGNSVTIGNTVTVAGTVTANNPNGTLTTRFGSVVTANTAGITTAVTNTSRKYLLAQNISAGTVTIGIGFSPTTTQGIQLTAGAGLTFDSFVPTGAVYWLGATTGAAYTILEG